MKCKIIREGVSEVKANDDAVIEASINQAELLGVDGINKFLEQGLLAEAVEKGKEAGIDIAEDTEEIEEKVRYLLGQLVPEEVIDKEIIDNYGTAGERYLLATKINALVTANPIIAGMVHEMILQFMPAGTQAATKAQRIKGEQINVPGFAGIDKNLTPEQQLLRTLKVQEAGLLKNIYHQAWQWANAGSGNNWNKGVIGRIVSRFFNPSQKGYTESSGAFFKFNRHISNYHTNVETEVEYYNKDIKVKQPDGSYKTFKGMKSILREISLLGDKVIIKQNPNDRRTKGEILVEFFIMNMMGEVSFDSKKKFFIGNTDFGPLQNKDGEYETWPDGSLKHGFSNPVRVTDKSFYNGLYDIKWTKGQLNTLKGLIKEANKVNQRVFKETQVKYKKSVVKLKKSIKKHFKTHLSDVDIEILFFEDWKVKQHKEVLDKMKAIDKAQNTTLMHKYNLFKDTFGNIATTNLYLNRMAEAQQEWDSKGEKKNYWPVIYPMQTMMLMWDGYIVDMQVKLEGADKSLKEAKKGTLSEDFSISGVKFKDDPKFIIDYLKGSVKDLKNMINRAVEIQEHKEDKYRWDSANNVEMPFARDHRHLKSITNAFDIRLGRKDAGTYTDYLTEVSSAIERNLLTITLLDSIGIAESNEVIDAMINYYKVPFNDPSIEGGFPFMTTSDESIAAFLNKAKIKVTPEMVNRTFRRWNKWLTASKLGGLSTAAVNRMARVHTVLDRNNEEVRRAMAIFTGNKEKVENFLTKINVASFQDFFSNNLINGKAGIELDNVTTERIYMAMLNFPKAKENFKKMGIAKMKRQLLEKNILTQKALDLLSKGKKSEVLEALSTKLASHESTLAFRKILDNSPMVNLMIKRINSKEEVQKRLENIKQSKIDTMLNKFVAFAITQELELNRYADMLDWRWTAPKKIYEWGRKTGGGFLEYIGGMRREAGWTMSDGEAYIRSISAISAVMKARELGYLRSDIDFWDYQGEDLRAAAEIGRLLADFSNMGLSTTDMAQIGWGGFGSVQQKFNIWAHQRRGREYRIMKYAYIAAMDLNKLGKTKFFDGKALAKVILKTIKGNLPFVGTSLNKMNATQKHQAHLMKFIYAGVMPALLMDLVIWGPLGNMIGFSILKKIGHMGGFDTALRGLPSSNARLLSLPIALAMRFALGMMDGDDEEEELANFLRYYLREVPGTGFGVSWNFDQVLLLYWIFSENNAEAIKTGTDVFLGPVVPTFTGEELPAVRQSIEWILKED
mgnify:CR=1 FL=1